MIIDDQIREILREGLGSDPRPLEPDELRDRATRGSVPTESHRAHRGLVAAACVVFVALLAGALATRVVEPSGDSGDPDSEPVAGTKVGRYFLPTELPDGYEMLGVVERAGDPAAVSFAEALYVDTATEAKIRLRATTPDGRWSTSDHTTSISGGVVRWSLFDVGDQGAVLNFQADLGDRLIDGEARGVDEADAPTLFDSLGMTGPNAIPTLDDPAYTLVASAPAGARKVVAEYSAYFGPPGGYFGKDGIELHVERLAAPIDVTLEAGVWDGVANVGGRTLHLGMFDLMPWWAPSPDIHVRVQTNASPGTDSLEQLATIAEVDDATLQAEFQTVTATAASVPNGQQVTFDSGATAVLLGDRGLCLTIEGERRCDLSIMSRNAYSVAGPLQATYSDLLFDGRWYTIGVQPAGTVTPSPGVETVVVGSRMWYLVAHPDDETIASQRDIWPGSPTRPAR